MEDTTSTTTDVNNGAVVASTDSSTDNNTATTESSTDTAGTVEEKTVSQSVPYERFDEVNSALKQVRQELDQLKTKVAPEPTIQPDPQSEIIKEQLKELGFVRKEDIDKDLRQRELDKQVSDEISRLEKTLDGVDGRPKFDRNKVIKFALDRQIGDLETAYEKLHQQDLIDWHIKNAMSKTAGVKSEASDGSGVKSVGTTNDDLKEAIKHGDKNALRVLLKRQFDH
jgi:hypothetical protein